MKIAILAAISLLSCKASAAPPSETISESTNSLERRSACSGNTPTSRSTWCDFSIDTDYYEHAPDTGVTREYWLEIVEATVAPDGISRTAMTFNGTVPGPTIYADWGDTLIIHVKNNINANGTSVHWHGIRQNYTNQNDGVASITQCAQAPNDIYTYTFRATQYGTTWYHSHFSLQAWEGMFGGMVINGPASANYDEDKGVLILTDWFHSTVNSLFDAAQRGGPPTADNGLINGTNISGDDGSSSQTGSRFETTFTAGRSYRIRLVNVAIDTHWKFSIDNHTLTVIAMDLVPIQPYTTNIVNIGIAQRYDIIVEADQSAVASDFWMRAIPQSACSANTMADNIRGIVHYGASTGTPTTTGYDYIDECVDETYSDLVPVVQKNAVADPFYQELEQVTLGFTSSNLIRWYINGSTLEVKWGDPTLLQVWSNDSSWNTSQNVIQLDEANRWAYVIIETSLAIAHPLHLHGHDFYLLAQDTGTYSSSTTLKLDNPPRRDVAILPASGHVVLAWETDNPGAWLMHCHIGWHTVQGLALQFVERFSEITSVIDGTALEDTCGNWNTYAVANNIIENDSGV